VVRRKELAQVDGRAFGRTFLADVRRQVLPEPLGERILSTRLQEHGDGGELAVHVPVHEVNGEGVRLPGHTLLRRVVEMKLDEIVSPAADRDETTGRVVDLHALTVVDDPRGDGA